MALTPVIARDGNNASQSMAAFQDPNNVNVAYVSMDTSQAFYRAAASFTSGSTAAGTVLTVQGSASKTVRIKRIGLILSGGTTQSNVMLLQRTSALGAGGTSTALTAGKMDSNSPAATCVVSSITATNKAAGTANGGPLSAINVLNVAGTTPTFSVAEQMSYPELGMPVGQAIVLRGASDFLEVQSAAALPASVVVTAFVEWVEDAS